MEKREMGKEGIEGYVGCGEETGEIEKGAEKKNRGRDAMKVKE